jgi:hypothetical protein
VISHPKLGSLRRWLLGTADAHALYTRFGFRPVGGDSRLMIIEREIRP